MGNCIVHSQLVQLCLLTFGLCSQFDGFQAARAGLKNGHAPKLASAGTGGSYFIAGADGTPVAVFKPLDEEPCAVNNPKVGSMLLNYR